MKEIKGYDIFLLFKEYSVYPEIINDEILQILEPFINDSPIVLRDFLDKPAGLNSICNSKLVFIDHCRRGGIYNELQKREVFKKIAADIIEAVDSLEIKLQELVKKNLESDNGERELLEMMLITGSELGLSDENKKRYTDSVLTIGDILISQPYIILEIFGKK